MNVRTMYQYPMPPYRKPSIWKRLLRLLFIILLIAVGAVFLIPGLAPMFYPIAATRIQVDWKKYYSNNDILQTLQVMNESLPMFVSVFQIGSTVQKREIYCIKITGLDTSTPKPKILIVGGLHAQERITSEVALYFAVWLVKNYTTSANAKKIVDNAEVYIIVASNPDGLAEAGLNPMQRKNCRPIDEDHDGLFDEDPPDDENGDGLIGALYSKNGTFIRWEGLDNDHDGLYNEDWIGGVDLNRNFGYQWTATVQSGSNDPTAEDYRGTAPFSEPETQAIQSLAATVHFDYALDLHSGTKLILYPWAYTNTSIPDATQFTTIARKMSEFTGAAYMQSANLYTCSGDFADWMYAEYGTTAFTLELYGNSTAIRQIPGPTEDTYWQVGDFDMYNPAPENIESIALEWLPAIAYVPLKATRNG